ncbi:alcohol dehydrogenase catalytic domain-containing protein [Nonomuraea wenchangensis]|uniref:alcohol dehydrogenase catalytic domain-containing protein n=1 Tax=Nonomuraea wenchangensis TaxID=568860 RepID=UPI0037A5F71E
MRAVVMEEFGGPEVLRIRQVEDPVPGPGQVLVAVAYASITFVETQVRSGNGPFGRPALPRIPGNGVGGRIVAAGPDVDPALMGTVVVTTTGGEGGYAELALARAQDAVPVPEGLELKDAVALLADGRTALLLYRQAEIKPSERVLVEAAGGGVGSLLVQLAAAADAGMRVGAVRRTGVAVTFVDSRGLSRQVLPDGGV